jgi:hypothetical protein
MNQLCKNLVSRGTLNKLLSFNNKINLLQSHQNCISSFPLAFSFQKSSLLNDKNKIALNGTINTTRSYVYNSNPNTSNFKYNKKFDYESRNRSGGRFSNERVQSTIEQDFQDAEPVESSGSLNLASTTSNSFANFDIPQSLLARLTELGYETPFEIQVATLEHSLSGRDVVGKAFTGSGKSWCILRFFF